MMAILIWISNRLWYWLSLSLLDALSFSLLQQISSVISCSNGFSVKILLLTREKCKLFLRLLRKSLALSPQEIINRTVRLQTTDSSRECLPERGCKTVIDFPIFLLSFTQTHTHLQTLSVLKPVKIYRKSSVFFSILLIIWFQLENEGEKRENCVRLPKLR